jgi:DNA-3-methyladenine glycosylase II
MPEFTIEPRGRFALSEAALFAFGQRHQTRFDGVMRLAFCLDGYRDHAGVALTQDAGGVVHAEVAGDAPVDAVRRQTARVLSLDVDATGYEEVGHRDPVVAGLLAAAPGLRPPLFHSPYEAAAWCVLSLRWNTRQAAAVRDRLANTHGLPVEVAGAAMAAFPAPEQLLTVAEFEGVPPVKIERLHGVARAAVDGRLAAEEIRRADPEAAMARLREIPGIGPFSASLIVLRASGVCDVPVEQEPRLAAIVGRLYDLPGPATAADMRRLGEAWRPFRTWVGVLLRAASNRVPQAA